MSSQSTVYVDSKPRLYVLFHGTDVLLIYAFHEFQFQWKN